MLRVTTGPELADAIDTLQRGSSATRAVLAAACAAAPDDRRPTAARLLFPTVTGAIACLVLGGQGLYRLATGEFMPAGEEVTAFVLVLVPLAFLVGICARSRRVREWRT
ncbi:MAG TPA: hypothetical protein VN213_19680 [Solirubrobacteraceae bacterium]|nr:hypothetical protein [Solirubrobacteraceae bacterium]